MTKVENCQKMVCPRCQNNCVTYCYLEWRIHRVIERKDDSIVVEGSSVTAGICSDSKTTMTNIPNVERDLSHYFCDSCHFNWYDSANRIYQ